MALRPLGSIWVGPSAGLRCWLLSRLPAKPGNLRCNICTCGNSEMKHGDQWISEGGLSSYDWQRKKVYFLKELWGSKESRLFQSRHWWLHRGEFHLKVDYLRASYCLCEERGLYVVNRVLKSDKPWITGWHCGTKGKEKKRKTAASVFLPFFLSLP